MSKKKPRSLFLGRMHGSTLHVSDIPGGDSPPKYLPRVEELVRTSGLGVGAHAVQVMHEDGCGIFKNRSCDCDPEVKMHQPIPAEYPS